MTIARMLGLQRIFEEAASGGRWDRPGLHRMLDQLREGDVVIVWKLDRLSRSLKDLLLIVRTIDDPRAHASWVGGGQGGWSGRWQAAQP